MLKSDRWIRKTCLEEKMIDPFVDRQDGPAGFRSGSPPTDTTSAWPTSTRFSPTSTAPWSIPRPSRPIPSWITKGPGASCLRTPFALARSVERFKIPRKVLAICLGKSTYARCGIIVNVTPLEPTWEGFLTIESPTPRRCRPRSTPTRASPSSCSWSPTRSARSATPTAAGNTKDQVGVVLPRILASAGAGKAAKAGKK